MSISALKAAVMEGGPVAVQPEHWPQPRGYANGMKGRGTLLMTGGLVGWDAAGQFPEGLIAQVRQTLENIVAVLEAGSARPEHLMRMTWYVTNMDDYRSSLRDLGKVYREVLGKHFPAMALVQVVSLVEPKALVEIEATAMVPD
ncbi:MAG: enamine deaminase RidA [Rhizobiales bacterium PAR1]|nr:MAG: enamine deaminase RidA [Rhizobiales bacterium PAR1]